MIVVVTAEAEADLERITDYIAGRSIVAALGFVQELRHQCETLADTPRRFALVPRFEHLGIRRCPFSDYLIFYRIGTESVDIVHIFHGARDYEPLLFP